jgi:CHAD domain-containing protein
VALKKVRALLRMAPMPENARARADKIAKDFKTALGEYRDRDVLISLARSFGERHAASRIVRRLDLGKRPADILATLKRDGLAAIARLGKLTTTAKISPAKQVDIETAWKSTYRAARRVMYMCQDDPTDDVLFHKWRIRVKRLQYQNGFLGLSDKEDSFLARVKKIGSTLGDHHDLAVLHERMCAKGIEKSVTKPVLARKSKAAREALQLGRKTFNKRLGT